MIQLYHGLWLWLYPLTLFPGLATVPGMDLARPPHFWKPEAQLGFRGQPHAQGRSLDTNNKECAFFFFLSSTKTNSCSPYDQQFINDEGLFLLLIFSYLIVWQAFIKMMGEDFSGSHRILQVRISFCPETDHLPTRFQSVEKIR